MAARLLNFFEWNRPRWADHPRLPKRMPTLLSIAAARGAGFTVEEVAQAFTFSKETAKTYHRDGSVLCCCTSSDEFGRMALLHVVQLDPQLAELLLSADGLGEVA